MLVKVTIELSAQCEEICCSSMEYQVDCNQGLEEIYEETMKLVKVSLCVGKTRPLLTHDRVSSSGNVTREKVLESSTRKHDPRLDQSDRTGRNERLGDCIWLDR